MCKICGISHTVLSGLVYVSGVLIELIKRPNRSTLCLAESNGIEPSSLAQWDGFQDRLSTMLPTLQSLWLPVLISGLATPATDCIAVCELASCVAGAFLSAHQSAHQPQRKEHSRLACHHEWQLRESNSENVLTCCALRFVELTAGEQAAPGWTYFSVMLLQESQIVMVGADLRHRVVASPAKRALL